MRFFSAIFIVLVLVLLLRSALAGPLGGALAVIARPFTVLESSVTRWLGEAGALLSSKQSLARENERLNDLLDAVTLEAYAREKLRSENETLRAALGRSSERELLLAKVLATPGRSPFDTLVIDIGTDHGLSNGMRVFTDGDFAVGEVDRVMGHSAVVTLYSTPGKELPVTVGSTSIPALLSGEGGGNFRITLPRGSEVSVGDIVEVPAFAPTYVGVVEALREHSGGSLIDLFVRWPFNVHTLSWVYVDAAPRATE